MQSPVVVMPPENLLTECKIDYTQDKTLTLLKDKKIKEAATEHTRTVLDMRDALDLCNTKIIYIKEYLTRMDEDYKMLRE